MVAVIRCKCPEYDMSSLDIQKIGRCIDKQLVTHFDGQKTVLRAISSADHELQKDELVRRIEQTGTDRYDPERAGDRYENIGGKHIDFFGQTRTIRLGKRLSLALLQGFHVYGAQLHGRPSPKMDIWLVYARSKVTAVPHYYEGRSTSKRDGYAFKDPAHRADALLGVLVIE